MMVNQFTWKKIAAIILSVCMSGALVACGNTSAASSSAPAPAAQSGAPASSQTAAGGDVQVPKFMTVGTGATGGAYYPIGVALAEILTNNLGTQATAQVTGGSLENLQLLNAGTCDIGIVQGNNMMDAYEGVGDYANGAYKNIAALSGGLSKGYFQVVVMDNSPIQTMSDLVGKKVCMGPAGNGAIAVANTIWGKYGFGTDKLNATYLAYDDGISQLEDGNCDAVVIQTAIPASAIQQLAASGKGYRLLSVDKAIADELCAEYGYFGYGKIAATVYDKMPADVDTMYISNMIAVRADLDEALVYEVTKSIFENLDTVKNSHKAASGLSLENAVHVSIPMHPGAERYFKEIGAM